jgi:3-oxoacyl-[acyl-carrier-protein] synthase II
MTGHMLGAAGPLGAAVTAMSIYDQKVHPTINLHNADPKCDLDYVPHVARSMKVKTGMVEALGFGGHNTVLVLSQYVA